MSKPFEKIEKDNWYRDIEKYLKNDTKIDNLYIKKDNIELEPFYTSNESILAKGFEKPNADVKNVYICNHESSNQDVLDALNSGVSAVLVTNDDNVSELLNGVDQRIVDVIIMSDSDDGENDFKHQFEINDDDNFASSTKNVIVKSQKGLIFFRPSIDFFSAVSRLRALRYYLSMMSYKFKIIGVIESEDINDIGDANLIELTYKTLSCYLGGADYIHYRNMENNDLRLASNITHIFNNESHLNKVVDPLHGAYFIEKYTEKVVEQIKNA